MLERHPVFVGTGVSQEWTEVTFDTFGLPGINVMVIQKLNQSALPADQRIPECIEGVPARRYAMGIFDMPDDLPVGALAD